MATTTSLIAEGWQDKLNVTFSAPSFTTTKQWTCSLSVIEQTKDSENVWQMEAFANAKKKKKDGLFSSYFPHSEELP